VNAALQPGRYVLLGGPGGYTCTRRVMRPLEGSHALDNGSDVIRTMTYTDTWQQLAAFRVRPGQVINHHGAVDAALRVWMLT
jgi:hypothetical protein